MLVLVMPKPCALGKGVVVAKKPKPRANPGGCAELCAGALVLDLPPVLGDGSCALSLSVGPR